MARIMTILISKVNQLGDNVVFLPVVQHLCQALPSARIVVVTSPGVRELYERCTPGVEVATCTTAEFNKAWASPIRLLQLIRAWRAQRPDAVLLGDDQGNVAHVLAACSGAAQIVGPLNTRLPANRLIGHRVALDLKTLVAHQNWNILHALGATLPIATPDLPPPPDLSAMVAPAAPTRDVVIHAGASRSYKRWLPDRYVALANHLVAQGHRVALVDQGMGETESLLNHRIERIKPGTLSELVSLLAKARLFVGNNSGPMNIASALGVPGVIFNGPSTANWDPAWHRERFTLLSDPALSCQPCDQLTHPVNMCQNVSEPMACMKRWDVAKVAAICEQKLRD
jgi:ADP-heptose:LPS heptosyltransferase